MAKRNNHTESGDDERLGGTAYGEPLIKPEDELPEEDAAPSFKDHATGDFRYARDDSDRLSDERTLGEREYSDEERLEMFRMMMFQQQLPELPADLFPGYHLCYLTTTNTRDPIQGRLQLGYELIRREEVPGWEHMSLDSGPFAGCIGVNEMIAAKLPLRLYELYMTEAHHNQPLAEEGKLRATLDAIREQADRSRTQVIAEEGTAQLGTAPRRPKFEGIPARAPRR